MASDDLTLRMRAANSRRTARDVGKVTSSVNVFSRAVTIAQTRAVLYGFAITAIGAAAIAAAPAIGLLTAAIVTGVGVALPALVLSAAAVQRYKATVDQVGSAASDLKAAGGVAKAAWDTATAPGADILLKALADALQMLAPVLAELKGPLTTFAKFMAQAIDIVAQGLVALGPELGQMIALMGQALVALAPAIAPLIGVLIDLAIAGMPVLLKLIDWIKSFAFWLRPAIRDAVTFFRSAEAANAVAVVFHVVATAAKFVASVVADLAVIAYQLFIALKPLLTILGIGLLIALQGAAKAIDWLRHNMGLTRPILMALIAAFILWKTWLVASMFVEKVAKAIYFLRGAMIAARSGTLGLMLAQYGLNTAMLLNPITLVVAALIAIGAAIYLAYKKSETFRNIIDGLWGALQSAASWASTAGTNIKEFLGGAIDWVIDKVQWLLDKLGAVKDAAATAADVVTPGGKHGLLSGDGLLGLPGVPGLATGGHVRRGGAAVVGERGPELLHLPGGSWVTPNGATAAGGGPSELVIHLTSVLDGKVAAKSTHRQAVKKQSVR